jgi:hypothetical protein
VSALIAATDSRSHFGAPDYNICGLQDHQLDEREEARATLAEGGAYGCPMARFKFNPTKDYAPLGQSGSIYLNTRTGWWVRVTREL